MKPEKGLEEMEEKVYDPWELYSQIGLLITEARTPEQSNKGRAEGPHCPPAKGTKLHECDRHKEQCRKSSDLIRVQDVLWQNKIPMRIDVLLFPNCEHGYHEETIVEGATFSCMDDFELLERWDIQMVKKRSPERMEGFVRGKVHLQAIRSYLHFSQLSSWLTSSQGCLPVRVVYRIYAPGESVGYTFNNLPEVHNFPSAELDNAVMQTSVAHLPRQDKFIIALCRSQSPTIQSHFRSRKRGDSEERFLKSKQTKIAPYPSTSTSTYHGKNDKFSELPRPSTSKGDNCYDKDTKHIRSDKQQKTVSGTSCAKDYGRAKDSGSSGGSVIQEQMKAKPPIGRILSDGVGSGRGIAVGVTVGAESRVKTRISPCPLSNTPKRKVDQLSPTMKYGHDFPSVTSSVTSVDCVGLPESSSLVSYTVCNAVNHSIVPFQNSYTSHVSDRSTLNQHVMEMLNSVPVPTAEGMSQKVKIHDPRIDDHEPIKSEFKTPDKVHSSKMYNSGYKKVVPSSLTVSTAHTGSTYIGTKRLPSPKVIVTGSKKPEPTNYKKRCLDLIKNPAAATSTSAADDVEQLVEMSSGDLRDLITQPSPSDLEAYISSLSSNNKAPKRHGSSKLDDIPTTKCSFFLGEEESSEMGQKIEEGAKVWEMDPKLRNCANATSLSIENEMCTKKSAKRPKDLSHVRSLFSDDELEQGVRKSTKFCAKMSSENNDIEQQYDKGLEKFDDHIGDGEVIVGKTKYAEDNEIVGKTKSTKSKKCGLSEKVGISDLHLKSLSREATPHNNSRESTPINVSREAIPKAKSDTVVSSSASKRETNLRDWSIPCSVGGGANQASEVLNLVENLESMDIDEQLPRTSNTHCHLDKEVEHHFSDTNMSSDIENNARVRGEYTSDIDNNLQTFNSQALPSDLAELADEMRARSSPKGASSSYTNGATSAERPTHLQDASDDSPTSAKDLNLCKHLLQKEFQQNVKNEMLTHSHREYKSLPSPDDIKQFQFVLGQSASAIFNTSTGLPSRSSPAPIKKKSSTRFDYDCSLTNVRAIKNAISCSKLTLLSEDNCDTIEDPKILSTSAPASTNCLLGNFEESVLNGRIQPVGVVEGFTVEIGAGGTFCPKHVTLPVIAYFFQLSDDNAPSPYLGYVNLEPLGKRGYHIPRTGTVQVTLFNPNKSVIKMFVVMYDLSDMPSGCQTFLRQRTMYMPVEPDCADPSYLRYLIHLRFQSSKSGKIYLHTDIRLIFARDKFEFDPRVGNYELRSFTEGPENPKFSPKR